MDFYGKRIGFALTGSHCTYDAVLPEIKKLVELGILKETTSASRNRVFAYEEYLKVLRKDT